jgi:hypothetical protein
MNYLTLFNNYCIIKNNGKINNKIKNEIFNKTEIKPVIGIKRKREE